MKRFIALICTVAILCGLLCSCSDGPVELSTDSMKDVAEMDIPMGTVVITDELRNALFWRFGSTRFQVCISFKSMVPDDYLDTLMYDGISASEYLERSLALRGIDEETASAYSRKYYELKNNYFYDLVEDLSYSGEKDTGAAACREYFFFYTTMTKSEIMSLTCEEDEAFCVFAIRMLK